MKKVLAILAIGFLASCGAAENTEAVVDSAATVAPAVDSTVSAVVDSAAVVLDSAAATVDSVIAK
jgi:uncharacterized lipoprotein YajG